jgi:predicted RNA-binding Zn ribbon-like protein
MSHKALHLQEGHFLKKPLQTEEKQFLLTSKGQLIGWGVADAKNLLKNANRALVQNLDFGPEATIHDAECIFAREWLTLFVDKGLTKEVIDRLNSRIAHVRYHHILMPSSKGLPYWRRIANADQIHEPELSVAYGVAHLLAYGAFEGLKRCSLKDCRKFFVGRSNVRWCSKSCGSLFRVRQKRRRDRS